MRTLYFFSTLAALAVPATAWAAGGSADKAPSSPAEQEKTKPSDAAAKPSDAAAKPSDAAAKPSDAAAKPSDAAAKPSDAAAKPSKAVEVNSKDFLTNAPDDPADPREKPHQVYRFVGLRFREAWIPKFMMTLFGDGGRTVSVPSVGPEFTIRKDGFEYVFAIQYSGYSMEQTPFKAKTDGETAWELVTANLKVLYLMTDFLWSTEIDPKFAVNYGAGLGLGLVFGDISRVQAFRPDGVTDPYNYQPCRAANHPSNSAGVIPYCGSDNNHYQDYKEPSWANGGSKPIVFPWLALQTGLRWKPHRQFMARFDLGWNLLNGPFLGIAANYGL